MEVIENSQLISVQIALVMELEDKLVELSTQRTHWERKSASLSKELTRLTSSHGDDSVDGMSFIQMKERVIDLKKENEILSAHIQVVVYGHTHIHNVYDYYFTMFTSLQPFISFSYPHFSTTTIPNRTIPYLKKRLPYLPLILMVLVVKKPAEHQ